MQGFKVKVSPIPGEPIKIEQILNLSYKPTTS